MNDRHLDPPDYPEPPECCGDLMDVLEDGSLSCPICGEVIPPAEEIDPPDCDLEDLPEVEDLEGPTEFIHGKPFYECPHGKLYGECDDCDHLADLAFDAYRENRFR